VYVREFFGRALICRHRAVALEYGEAGGTKGVRELDVQSRHVVEGI
jgi:hypothetical protein